MFDSCTKSCGRFFVITASLQNLDFRDINEVLHIVAIFATTCNTPIKFEALSKDPHKVMPSHLKETTTKEPDSRGPVFLLQLEPTLYAQISADTTVALPNTHRLQLRRKREALASYTTQCEKVRP
jgi:hypothetical protein